MKKVNFPNGSFKVSGMVGEVWKEDSDLAIASFFPTFERSLFVDFSTPFINEEVLMVIKNPDDKDVNWYPYLDPFHHYVWLCIVITIIVTALLLHFAFAIGSKNSPEQKEFLFTKSLIFTFGSFTFIRRWSVTPKKVSTRIIFITGTFSKNIYIQTIFTGCKYT